MAEKESTTEMVPATISNAKQKLPNDLIDEIMLRCNLRTVHRCKCVYKDRNRILSAPSFRVAYLSLYQKDVTETPPLLLGFFNFKKMPSAPRMIGYPYPVERPYHRDQVEIPQGFSFLSTDLQGEPLYSLKILNSINRGNFQSVSNGLVLCGDYPYLHVFNPITRKIFSLPRSNFNPQNYLSAASPGFISSQVDNDFRVNVPFTPKYHKLWSSKLFFEIYSSNTGVWTQSEVVAVAVARFKIGASGMSPSFDGTCFWFTRDRDHIVAYNPCLDDTHVQLIKLPPRSIYQTFSLCQSRDGFLQCAVDDCHLRGFRVYILAKALPSYGYEAVVHEKEWALAYPVKLDKLDTNWILYQRIFGGYSDEYVFRFGFHPRTLYLIVGTDIYSCDVENCDVRRIPYAGHLHSGSDQ